MTDKIRGNPYKLVANVLLFALKHKSPIRRSAFTFCEDELPSRIDFSKRRYGGPYSTDQVENVKVLLNILKILFSSGLVLFLEFALNYFKRISLSILILTVYVVMYLIYDGLVYEFDSNHYSLFKYCTISNSSTTLNWSIVYFPQDVHANNTDNSFCTFPHASLHQCVGAHMFSESGKQERTSIWITICH